MKQETVQTQRSFREKWANNPDAAFALTNTEGSSVQQWILSRNGFADLPALRRHLAGKRRILDAGCGNGRVTALLASVFDGEVWGCDLTAAPVAAANLADVRNVTIRPADLLGDLKDLGEFDFIYCQEVLHHTADPRAAFLNLVNRLSPGGEIAIYVYRVKAPIREYADDYIRAAIKDMPYEKAMAEAHALTELGRILSGVEGEIEVPDVQVLGVKAGRYTVQRLIYHTFAKLFWNPEMTHHENVVVNYDWYHPATATRHTMTEVLDWYRQAGLHVVHEFEDAYGITIRGVRT